jgi:hypothetical protein
LNVRRTLQTLQSLDHTVDLNWLSLRCTNRQKEDTNKQDKHAAELPQPGAGLLTEVGGNDSVHTLKLRVTPGDYPACRNCVVNLIQ